MFMVNEVITQGAKIGVETTTPFGKISWYVTLVFLFILIVWSSIQAVEEKSVFPFFDNFLFRILGSDHKIGESVDNLNDSKIEGLGGGVFSSGFWRGLWVRLVFWFEIVINLWFLGVLVYLLYLFFAWVNNTNPMLNWLFAIMVFVVLNFVVGLLFFVMNHAGETLPGDRLVSFNLAVSESYPFEGVVKLVGHLWSRDLFSRGVDVVNSPAGELVGLIPGNSNFTNVSVNGGVN